MSDQTKVIRVAEGLSLTVPPAVEPAGAQGIDSPIGVWQGDGITVLVDEGPFADTLTSHAEKREYQQGPDTLAGRPARVVSFIDSDGMCVAGARLIPGASAEESQSAVTVTVRTPARLGPDFARGIIETLSAE